MQVEAKIEELGLTLPTPGTPMGNYVPASAPATWCS